MSDPLKTGRPDPSELGKRRATEKPWHCEAYQLYLQLRSIRSVAERIGKREKLVQEWSSKFQWVARAAADDVRKAGILAEEADRQTRQVATLWTKRKTEHVEEKFQISGGMMTRGNRKMHLPDTERVIKAGNGPAIFRPRSDKDAVALILSGSKLRDEAIAEALASTTKLQDIEEFELDPIGRNNDDPKT
jgi:hypothetical protein